jgi:hypothetical protein
MAPEIAAQMGPPAQEVDMDWMLAISFDTLVMSAITCLLIREALIVALPDRIAGPGGSFIDTGRE